MKLANALTIIKFLITINSLLTANADILWTTTTISDINYVSWKEFSSSYISKCFILAHLNIDRTDSSILSYSVQFDDNYKLCSIKQAKTPSASINLGYVKCRKIVKDMYISSENKFYWYNQQHIKDLNACWKTFQHRVNDSVNFNRSWNDYKMGFGEDSSRNFWLGLEKVHQDTKDAGKKLWVQFKDWNDTVYDANYDGFQVQSEAEKYKNTWSAMDVATSSPKTSDSMKYSLNMKFSTFDFDNDLSGLNCAAKHASGWWHKNCLEASPNGLYHYHPAALSISYAKGIIWKSPFGPYYSMKEIELLYLHTTPP